LYFHSQSNTDPQVNFYGAKEPFYFPSHRVKGRLHTGTCVETLKSQCDELSEKVITAHNSCTFQISDKNGSDWPK